MRGLALNTDKNGLDEVEVFALLETDNGLLPVIGATSIGTTLALQFTGLVESAHTHNLLAEQLFDGSLDLEFVGTTIHFEDNFIVELVQHGGLLRDADVLNDLIKIFHGTVRSGLGCASGEGFQAILNEEDGIGVKHLLDIHTVGGDKLCPRHVTRGEVSLLVKALGDNQDLLGSRLG